MPVFFSTNLYPQLVWTDYSGNPVFGVNDDTSASDIFAPNVLVDGAVFQLWYSRINSTTVKIGHCTSNDGINWILIDTLALEASADTSRFDSKRVAYSSVIKDNGVYKMWYSGFNSNAGNIGGNIGYATSPDGNVWTKIDGLGLGKSVYDLTMDGSGAASLLNPWVIKDDSTYKMWYTFYIPSDGYRISYATSPDGISWTKVPGPGTHGSVIDLGTGAISFDKKAAYGMAVIKNNNAFEMWYSGLEEGFSPGGIGYATSADGINWTKINGAYPNSSCKDYGEFPTVILSGNTYKMWYSDGMFFYYSTSGTAGIQEKANGLVYFFPNPSVNGIFNVQITNFESRINEMKIAVTNILGESVYQLNKSENKMPLSIDLSTQPKGIYFVKISTGEDITVQKIIYQ